MGLKEANMIFKLFINYNDPSVRRKQSGEQDHICPHDEVIGIKSAAQKYVSRQQVVSSDDSDFGDIYEK